MAMSENRKMLLAIAARNGGVLKAEQAHNLYSSPQSARSALAALKMKRYISVLQPGVFKLEKLPAKVRQEYDVDND